MSRNFARIDCHECPGTHEHIILESEVRAVTKEDVGPHYFSQYRGLIVANARCVLCHALYLAWVDWPGQSIEHFRLNDLKKEWGQRFCDLSFRQAFNDEPSIEDLPLFEVKQVVSYERKLLASHTYLPEFGHEEKRAERVEAYRARQEAVRGVSVFDEIASLKAGKR